MLDQFCVLLTHFSLQALVMGCTLLLSLVRICFREPLLKSPHWVSSHAINITITMHNNFSEWVRVLAFLGTRCKNRSVYTRLWCCYEAYLAQEEGNWVRLVPFSVERSRVNIRYASGRNRVL